MKSVIVEGENYVTTALGWTQDQTKPIGMVIDLAPAHICARVIFINPSDASAALGTKGDSWAVQNDSIPKYGLEGRVIYMHPDVTTPV
jgi:hypothetical protein